MWLDNLLLKDASFKGISFKVEDHEAEFGRRLVPNEYPYRDTPYTEDMGRMARRYTITAYVIGDNYTVARDALIDAVEVGGEGILVHPYLGTKNVICETARVRENKNEGRIAILTFSFVEAGSRLFPDSSPIPTALVALRADDLISSARSAFINGMTVSGVSEWVRDSYSGTLGDVADLFDVIRNNGGINKQTTLALINKAATWVADVADLSSPSIGLIQDLAGTADRIISALAGVFDLSPSADTAALNLQRFANFTAPRNGALTAAAMTADNNATISETFVRSVSLATETKAAVQREYKSYEEAISARKNILDRIDTLAGMTADDTIYDAFRSLRAEVALAIPGESTSLPRIDTISLKESAPSLVMAYDLYETVADEQSIIDRNRIRHPAFVPGGQNLSILRYDENTA